MRKKVLGFSVVGVLLLSGCARDATFLKSTDDITCHADARSLLTAYENPDNPDQPRALTGAVAPPSFLLLSGGGSHGAWGAGFLKGWRDEGDSPFHVVTGVSTGALQATHAFLGEYETLFTLYTTSDNSTISKKRFFLTIPFSNSLRTVKPLRKLLERYITEDVVERVGNQADDRLLCVGSTELQSGRFIEWDLTEIARRMRAAPRDSDERRYWLELYREVIVASTAVPVTFPPVPFELDGRDLLHVDGGVRASLFIAFRNVLDRYNTLRRKAEARDNAAQWQDAEVYLVVNGKLATTPVEPSTSIASLALRSLSLVGAQSSFGSFYEVEFLLREKEDVIGKAKTRATFIPDDYCLEMTALDFDRAGMNRLAAAGSADGGVPIWRTPDPNAVSAPGCDR